MKSYGELLNFYYEKLRPSLEDLEQMRIQLSSKLKLVIAFLGGIGGSLFWLLATYHPDMVFFIMIVVVLYGLYAVIERILSREYRSRFKQKIIEPLVLAMDSSFFYHPEGSVSRSLFESSKLFRHRIDRYNGNDWVVGTIDGVAIEFSDVLAEYYTTDTKGNTHWHTLFKGLLIVADFPKSFQGNLFVLPDIAQKHFGFIGNFFQSLGSSYGELITLDDPRFEKEFVVYGSDQIEARYLLTNSLMEKIVLLRIKSGVNLFVSFVDTKIFLALSYKKDMFEPTIFYSLLSYKQVKTYVQTLHIAMSIIDELRLNDTIWLKNRKDER